MNLKLHLLIMVVLLSLKMYAQSVPPAQLTEGQQLFATVISNSIKDIRGLRNFVYDQQVHTALDYPWKRTYNEREFETVIADGRVFRQEPGQAKNRRSSPTKPSAAEVARAPKFDTTMVFGADIPFEQLPKWFDVVSVDRSSKKITFVAKRNNTPADVPDFQVKVTADSRSQKVLSAEYELKHPTNFYRTERVLCTFGNQRGYWLPARIEVNGTTLHQVHVYRVNIITYKSFQVSSKILLGPD